MLTPLTIDSCVDVDGKEVERLIDLQVNAPGVDLAGPANAVRLDITCDGGGIAMNAWDPVSGQRAHRSIPLTATAQTTRPRLLAISAVELAATVLAEAQARTPVPQADESVTATGAAAPPGGWAWWLVAFGAAEFFPSLTNMEGGGLRLGFDGDGGFGASINAQAMFGQAVITNGSASIMSLSLRPLVTVHGTLGRYTVRVGTGPRFAVGRMEGHYPDIPTLERILMKPWIGWPLQVEIGTALSRYLTADLTVEGGYVVAPLRGRVGGERKLNFEGFWVGAALSFGVRL